MANLNFYSYRRSMAAENAQQNEQRLKGQFELTLQGMHDGPAELVPVEFMLMGPQDVGSLKPGAVRRTYPVNGSFDVDTDKCPYVEFAADDLPWRYSLDPNRAGMRPWLLLIVGTADELTLLPENKVVLSQRLVDAYEPANFLEGLREKAHLWTHVQEHEGTLVSRLLSPRKLEPSKTYIAVLVRAFDEKGTFGLQSLTPVRAEYSWRFTTSVSESSFVDLANRLYPLKPIPENMGMAPVAYQTASDQTDLKPQMLAQGALVGLRVAEPEPVPEDVRDHFAFIRPQAGPNDQHDDDGRPLVQLPLYGQPWLGLEEEEPAWMKELNDDPRHRGTAGLGMWAGIEWQERIVDAASQQLGAFYSAARRIRQLTMGLAASRSLWDRRLPVEENQRLQVLGPAMSRMAATSGVSALAHVTARDRAMPPALFSSAARRLLRPGTARARLAKADALAPAALLKSMNSCPPESREYPEGLPHADILCSEPLDNKIAAILEQGDRLEIPGIAVEESQLVHDDERQQRDEAGLNDDDSWSQIWNPDFYGMHHVLLINAYAPHPERPCESEDKDLPIKLSSLLQREISPHGDNAFVIRRALATINGLDDQPLTPPELCLDFHIPAWKFLREFAKDWFLPGLGQMHFMKQDEAGEEIIDQEKDPVIAAKANGRFSDAFLVGFNQQALAELRWRNVPVAAGCTPLRRFWEPLRPDPPNGDGQAGEDIRGIHTWGDTPLGFVGHETPEAAGDNLVLIFKSQLWRRYPETLIYLLPEQMDKPDWNAEHITPNLHVEIDEDTVAFGFTQDESILDNHWLVIEQVPRGFNFYNLSKPEGQMANMMAAGADFAAAAFAKPVRVLIRGSEFQ